MSWKAFYILKIASLLWRRRCWWAIYRNVPFALDFLIRKRSMWVLKMITMWPEDGWLPCPRSIVLSDATSRVVLASELALASAFDTRTVPEWGLHRGTINQLVLVQGGTWGSVCLCTSDSGHTDCDLQAPESFLSTGGEKRGGTLHESLWERRAPDFCLGMQRKGQVQVVITILRRLSISLASQVICLFTSK